MNLLIKTPTLSEKSRNLRTDDITGKFLRY